jgi:hypothetical protein
MSLESINTASPVSINFPLNQFICFPKPLAGVSQVVSLEALWGQPSVVPLLEYGVTCSLNGARQWVMVFPRYASSMREWRLRRSGRGLVPQDLPIYLRLFMQVC